MQKLLIFFSKNISVHAIFDEQSFNGTLPNNIVSFEQLGPGVQVLEYFKYSQISMARTYLGLRKCFLDIATSSH